MRSAGGGYTGDMTIGGSLVLIAAGAILKWAVTATVSGVNLHTVGTVLLVIGLVGFVLACAYAFGPWGRQTTTVTRRTDVPPGGGAY
jgi:hypothetical protein